jgi:hypothetical protein
MALDMKALREKPAPWWHPPKVENHLPIDDAYVMLRFCLLSETPCETKKWKIQCRIPSFCASLWRYGRSHSAGGDSSQSAWARAANRCRYWGTPSFGRKALSFPISYSSCDELHRLSIASSNEKGV